MRAPDARGWTVPATAEHVPRIRQAVVEFARAAGLAEAALDALRLALTEAAANVVVHAYRDRDAPGRLHVSAAVDRGELAVVVGDEGMGLGPREDSPGIGLGLALIAEVADGFAVDHPAGGGTRVTLRFRLAPG